MKEKVIKYVDNLFGEIQNSQQISELKEGNRTENGKVDYEEAYKF